MNIPAEREPRRPLAVVLLEDPDLMVRPAGEHLLEADGVGLRVQHRIRCAIVFGHGRPPCVFRPTPSCTCPDGSGGSSATRPCPTRGSPRPRGRLSCRTPP